MAVDAGTVANAGVAALTIVATGVQLWRQYASGSMGRIKTKLDLMLLLPEQSDARRSLQRHIEGQVEQLIYRDEHARRDPLGSTLAIVFLLAAGWLAYQGLVTIGGWRWALYAAAIALALFGSVGFSQDGVRRPRDAKGRPVPVIQLPDDGRAGGTAPTPHAPGARPAEGGPGS